MSGGGKKSTKKTDAPATATQPMQTIQPGMPGQLDVLSQQLAAGFGQQPGDVMSQLMQYYQPMALPNYAPPAPAAPTPVTPKPTPKPVVTAPKPAGALSPTGTRGDRTWGR